MKTILKITRFLIAITTSLHLRGLSATIKLGERAVAKAERRADDARSTRYAAEQILREARKQAADARVAERNAKSAQSGIVSACVAEADGLRRNHTVGIA